MHLALLQVGEEIERLLARQQELHKRRDVLQRVLELDKRAPKRDWEGTFPWDDHVLALLAERFNLQRFRYVTRC